MIECLARARIPGDARDKSGLDTPLEDGTPAETLGGFGSAIAWTGSGDRYVAAVDRGPHDGATSFADRVQWFDFVLDARADGGLAATLVATTLLVDENGRTLTGRSDAYDENAPERGLRFDAEGVRVSRRGSLYVSDEYGPWIVEFSSEGRMLRRFAVPERFRVRHLGSSKEESIAGNDVGRVTNHGFEGLAASPDGSTLFALLQHPLIQDGGREGVNTRLLEVAVEGGYAREFVVVLDDKDLVFNEITAIGARRFLAIERDHSSGRKARVKRIVEIDIDGASDVSKIDRLPNKGLPGGVAAARKRTVLDLLDARLELAGDDFPEKIEGLCFGPDLPDGRHRLLVASDNDLRTDRASFVWMFAVPDAARDGYEAQAFDK